jgi:glycosyltransferase involved in cell wall biosynthesis
LGVASVVTLDSGELVSLPAIRYGLQRTWRGRLSVAFACRVASRVTVCTEYMRELAWAHGLDVAVVPIGVDPSAFRPARRPADGPPWRLLQVASLNTVKDQRMLIDVVAALRRRGVDVTLDLVGEDTLGGALHAQAAARDVADAVRFHGFQPTDRLPAFFERAHLYVQSSRHEAAGVAVLEAAVAGLPIVGTAVGYVRDWDGTAAAAVPPAYGEALACAIHELLHSPARRQRMADAALAWARAHDADWTANAMEKIYGEVTSNE